MNEDQKLAFDLFTEGHNIMITGSAGTGKSYVIREIIKYLKNKYSQPQLQLNAQANLNYFQQKVAVTSLTGVSSINIEGQTLHSWAGIGLGEPDPQHLVKYIRRRGKDADWRSVEVLIIDEISMMSAELFEKLNEIGCILRRNTHQLFGGIQLVLSGDFCQLPPIGDKVKFCFESPIWRRYVRHQIYLKKIFRQTDPTFQSLLSRLRLGIVTETDKLLLQAKIVPKMPKDKIRPTKLFPFKKDVEGINNNHYQKLIAKGNQHFSHMPLYLYRNKPDFNLMAISDIRLRQEIVQLQQSAVQVLRAHSGREILKMGNIPQNTLVNLCLEAQVMLNYNLNLSEGLVNGSRGVIIDFVGEHNDPVIEFDNGLTRTITRVEIPREYPYYNVGISQYPLQLAWASTIHKSQSMTLSKVVTDLNCVFSPGQTYVCLSRVRSLDGLYLLAIDFSKIRCHPKAKEYYDHLGFDCSLQYTPSCQLDPWVAKSSFPGQNKSFNQVCRKCLEIYLEWTLATIGYHLGRETYQLIVRHL